MSSHFSRRNGPKRPRTVAPPRVGHYYLTPNDRRMFCLNDTARQFIREGVPVNPTDLEAHPLLHLDGTPVKAGELPLLLSWGDGKAHEATFLLPRIDGPPQTLTWNAAPLTGEDHKVVGIAMTGVLAAYSPDWEELAGLAHDLRTPLQTMALLVPLLQNQPRPESLPEILTRLRGASERAMGIGKELLEWCREPVNARQSAHREWIVLETLLRGLAGEHETTAKSKGIVLQIELETLKGVEMFSNRVRLGRVVGNLLSNAVRYTKIGRVQLVARWRTSPTPGRTGLVLAVEDTGAGMTEEEQESIFQPYQRGRAGQSDSDSGGSGLGLATVDRLVGELGLALEMSSEAGQGSRFELLVPQELLRRVG